MRKFGQISILFVICFFIWGKWELVAQCSQCKAAVATKDAAGNLIIGAGVNTGVLYLLALPFILIGVLGGAWWWNNRKMRMAEEVSPQ